MWITTLSSNDSFFDAPSATSVFGLFGLRSATTSMIVLTTCEGSSSSRMPMARSASSNILTRAVVLVVSRGRVTKQNL